MEYLALSQQRLSQEVSTAMREMTKRSKEHVYVHSEASDHAGRKVLNLGTGILKEPGQLIRRLISVEVAPYSVKIVHTCAGGKVDNKMGCSPCRDFVLDDSYKLHQLLGSPAIDVKILKSMESNGFRTGRLEIRTNSHTLQVFAFPR